MSITYTPINDYAAKDALPANDPAKVVRGTEFSEDFVAISDAFALAAPAASPTFSGTASFTNIAVTGTATFANISATGTVDGRDVSVDGAKLDGIEAAADVTDTANVTAAGALMDSELTNITAVKALNQGVATTDSPTFANITATGTLAASGYNDTNWNTAYNDKINSASFNTGNGILTLTQQDAGTVTVDLDGRYSQTDTDTTYTAGTNLTLAGTTFNVNTTLTGLTDVQTGIVSIGLWDIRLDGSDLRFVYNGVDRLRITTTGAVIAGNDVTAFGSP
jgi:hypothetical protein